MKKFDESNDKRYIFEIDANYPKTLQKAQSGLPFSQRKDENLSNIKNLSVIFVTRKNLSHT